MKHTLRDPTKTLKMCNIAKLWNIPYVVPKDFWAQAQLTNCLPTIF